MTEALNTVINSFAFDGEVVESKPFGSGHINDTLLLTTAKGSQYILQRMNTFVFTDPQALMENVFGVTEFLKKNTIPAPNAVIKYVNKVAINA